MKVEKGDFIEFEFIARVKGGDVYDTNIKEEAKKIGFKEEVAPSLICIGQGMILKGLDSAFPGKELGKEYELELKPTEAFGNRDKKLVRVYPLKAFLERNIKPYPGLVLALDNMLAKIISVTGGRVTIDMNNPLSGKDVIYKFTIKRKVEAVEEKARALKEFFYGKYAEFEVKDSNIIIKAPKQLEKFILTYKDKFKELLNLDMVFEEKEIKQEEKKEEKQQI